MFKNLIEKSVRTVHEEIPSVHVRTFFCVIFPSGNRIMYSLPGRLMPCLCRACIRQKTVEYKAFRD